MDEKKMKVLLLHSVEEVFKKMIAIDITEKDAEHYQNPVNEPFLTASIGYAGQMNGNVIIRCSQDLSKLITSKMLYIDISNVQLEETTDAIGEVVNMVAGKFKALFSEFYAEGRDTVKMTVPTVVLGKNYNLYPVGGQKSMEVVMEIEQQKIGIMLSIKE